MPHQYRVITMARQFGSGGGPIACKLAQRLGWELLDNSLISRVANVAKVDRHTCEQLDESVDTWLGRLARQAFGRGGFDYAGNPDVFDTDRMVSVTRQLILDAAQLGNCVIVGRGGQCILRDRKDVFHAFVYAPLEVRIRNVREKLGAEHATPDAIRASDRERAAYVKHHYQCEWCNPLLYDAMFAATLGEDTVVDAILAAMEMHPQPSEHAHASRT